MPKSTSRTTMPRGTPNSHKIVALIVASMWVDCDTSRTQRELRALYPSQRAFPCKALRPPREQPAQAYRGNLYAPAEIVARRMPPARHPGRDHARRAERGASPTPCSRAVGSASATNCSRFRGGRSRWTRTTLLRACRSARRRFFCCRTGYVDCSAIRGSWLTEGGTIDDAFHDNTGYQAYRRTHQ